MIKLDISDRDRTPTRQLKRIKRTEEVADTIPEIPIKRVIKSRFNSVGFYSIQNKGMDEAF